MRLITLEPPCETAQAFTEPKHVHVGRVLTPPLSVMASVRHVPDPVQPRGKCRSTELIELIVVTHCIG